MAVEVSRLDRQEAEHPSARHMYCPWKKQKVLPEQPKGKLPKKPRSGMRPRFTELTSFQMLLIHGPHLEYQTKAFYHYLPRELKLRVRDGGTLTAAARSAWYPAPDPVSGGGALCTGAVRRSRGRTKHRGLRRPRAAAAGQVGQSRGDEGVPRAGKRGTDLDGAGVLAVVQQPHGAAVLALQAPAAAAHQPAQHLPARPPAPGRDAAALRTPDQAPLSRAAPRGPRAPAPSPQPGRGRCLLLSQLLLLLLLLLRHRLPPAPSKRPALSPPRPTPHAQFVGRGLGRRGANGGQRGGTEWQREEPIEIGPGVGTRLDKCLLRGIRLDSASGAKSHTLQRRESRPLGSRGGARKQSPHLQNAGTFRSGPGGCPHLSCTPEDKRD
ncbi:translation initiation factor IF-2-like [Panthera uncia]|uniref:translation initiation factor IF-2-like n=1 Tax=Panthera uncia TaxID=29064 RepID=UPI0020FFD9D0|nr:translation initiation factor IF-2-like [Panthera uncia]